MGRTTNLATFLGVVAGLVATGGCSGGDDTTPTTTLDIMKETSPYKCLEEMTSVVSLMVDNRDYNLAWKLWGSQSPATEYAISLASVIMNVQIQEGTEVAFEKLTEYAASACFDGDIANDISRAQPGEDGYVTACLDGRIPHPGDPVCNLGLPAAETPATAQPAVPPTQQPPTAPTNTQPQVAHNEATADDASLPGIGNGRPAPWEVSLSAEEAGVGDVAAAVRGDPDLSACPVIWPVDALVEADGTGEGLPGFLTWGLSINVQTPGGTDWGGAAVWLDGLAPTDVSFEPSAVVGEYMLANGDKLELAWGQSNIARITTESGCVWDFMAGSGYGLEVVVRSLATITGDATPTAVSPASTSICVRDNIDFAALRSVPDVNGDLLAQIPPGSCDVVLVEPGTAHGSGFAWLHVQWAGIDGWTALSNTVQ